MSWMTFRTVATVEAIIFAALFVIYCFFVPVLILDWGITVSEDVIFMGKRVGSAMAGAAVLLWCARGITDAAAQRVVAYGIATMLILVALFGLYEILRGFASNGLWGAALTELIMAAVLLFSVRRS